MTAVEVLEIAAEGGDFDYAGVPHQHHSEMGADQIRLRGNRREDFFRARRGGNVEIFGCRSRAGGRGRSRRQPRGMAGFAAGGRRRSAGLERGQLFC